MRPALARPTLLRPGSASMPQLPTRPLPVQIKTAATHLMPPPGVLNPVQRDKKTGGAYSAAGDDDINDVAAMGGVNLAEEANVSCVSCLVILTFTVIFNRGYWEPQTMSGPSSDLSRTSLSFKLVSSVREQPGSARRR